MPTRNDPPPSIAAWFHDHGVGVFPIVPGTKKPACSYTTFTATRVQAVRFSKAYGIRLAGLLVMNADSLYR
jgi:hypothetical protein